MNQIFKVGFLFRNIISSKKRKVLIKRYSQKNAHIFFGYYDITPFSNNNRYLLAQKIGIKNRITKNFDKLYVGYFDIENNQDFIEVGSTNTWN